MPVTDAIVRLRCGRLVDLGAVYLLSFFADLSKKVNPSGDRTCCLDVGYFKFSIICENGRTILENN